MGSRYTPAGRNRHEADGRRTASLYLDDDIKEAKLEESPDIR